MHKDIKCFKKALKKNLKAFHEDGKFNIANGDLEETKEIAETLRYLMIIDRKDENNYAEKYPMASQFMDEIEGAKSKLRLYEMTKDPELLTQAVTELKHATYFAPKAKMEMKTEKEIKWHDKFMAEYAELMRKVESIKM